MIPDYVMTRNEQARAAGLQITKQELTDGRLTTWYEGTEAQWRGSPFCRRKADRPFPKRSYVRDIQCFSLDRSCLVVRHLGSGRYRGVIGGEVLPEWVEPVSEGVVAYGVHSDGAPAVAYVGDLDELIERKIAPPEARTASFGRDQSTFHYGPVIWNTQRLPDGRAVFWDNVGIRERLARERADSNKVNFAKPADMLVFLELMICGHALRDLDRFSRVETHSGQIFTLSAESLAAIRDGLSDVADAIRGARVGARSANPEMRQIQERATVAHGDGAFQRFLGASGVRHA